MSEPRSEKTFRERCLATDESVMFCIGDATTANSEFEDDGSLHAAIARNSRYRERGCTIEQFREALEIVKSRKTP